MILVVCKLCIMGFMQGWGGLLLIDGSVLTGTNADGNSA
jgi:hypothetical protein